ncbi:MAG: riboflavin synthase [Pelagibacterales bacterium]|nr:riboflavin synthase [Pelagibacterales bacterium]|tara:strand:+ start:1406 stop:1987 length:582 start_codon:yes stop_codon:yes gene_type:complete
MFTGITENIGVIKSISKRDPIAYNIETNMILKDVKIGSSIMCSGICLTIVKKTKKSFYVNLSEETLKVTTAKNWKVGTKVNLEKSLKVGDEIAGHFVSGHVDGITELEEKKVLKKSTLLNFALSKKIAKFICEKGSVTIDGVSLTVNTVFKNKFSINIIPHTNKVTTLGKLKKGDMVNIEIDILARYINKSIN